ncbi:MAG: outer membrane beta-barrel protein, partial [Bacteroidota bacterium]
FVEIRDFDITEDLNRTLSFGARLNIYLNRPTYNSRKSATPGLKAGTMMIGGSSGLLSFDLDDADTRSFSIEPQFFYFLNPQLALGTGLLVGFGRQDNSFINSNSTSLSISPQVRYYLNSDQRNLYFLAMGLNVDYDRMRSESSFFTTGPTEQTFSETTVDFAIGAGLNSFVARNIALEIGPSIRIDPDDRDVRLGIDFGVQVFLNTAEKESSPNDFGG